MVEPAETDASVPMSEPSNRRPGRVDKVLVAGHFTKPVAKQLKQIALDEETTVQALLGQGIAHVFNERRKSLTGKLVDRLLDELGQDGRSQKASEEA